MDMNDIEVQKLMDAADDLRAAGKYQEAVGKYLEALKKAKEDWDQGVKDVDWQKKAIFMACNGMGMCYSKLGKVDATIENFSDAVEYAPDEEARAIALGNLSKYQRAVKDKTNEWPVSDFDDTIGDSFTFVLTPELLLDVEHNPLLDFLQSTISSNDRVNLYKLCQKVSFSVHGYDDDPRELYEVREFILFCRVLSLKFPFFFYFLPRPLSMLVVMGALEGKPVSETRLVNGFPVVQKMSQMDPEMLDAFTRKCTEEAVKFGMHTGHREKEMRDLFL